MTQVRLELDEYTIRVLDVVKGKLRLKNRSEALKRFALDNGSSFVEPEVNEDALREIDAVFTEHRRKYGLRKMTMKQLDTLLGL